MTQKLVTSEEMRALEQGSVQQGVSVEQLMDNAGLALGLTPVESTPDDYWTGMWEANVLGLLRMTRACLPLLRKAPYGHIVNLGSIAAQLAKEYPENYPATLGYTVVPAALRPVARR